MTKKKGEFTVLRNIRAGMVIILLIYIGLIFQSKGDSDTPFADVQKAVVDAADDKNMTLAGTQEIKRFYGINPKDYEDITLYYTNETMGVNELLLVTTKDENEAEAVEKELANIAKGATMRAVEKAAEQRKKTQLDNFEGYGAEQVKLLDASIIKTKGTYVLFVISPKAETVEKAFTKSLK